jgi:natural product precursor
MKKLSKLKLNVLREQDLAEKQMNSLKGGYLIRECTCSCQGISSDLDNRNANLGIGSNGGSSTGGCQQYAYSYDSLEGYITSDCSFCNESYPHPTYI